MHQSDLIFEAVLLVLCIVSIPFLFRRIQHEGQKLFPKTDSDTWKADEMRYNPMLYESSDDGE